MERILLIEDDQALGRGTALALAGEGREIRVAATLAQGWAALGEGEYALVLLDLNLPDGNGLDFLTALRRTSGVPVLILTANDLESDQVAGLELGADDYVTKPFSLAVLLAKTEALIRRSRGGGAETLACGAITLEPGRRACTVGGRLVALPPREYELLLCLVRNKGQVLRREQLLDKVWGIDFEGGDRAVDGRIKALRAALGPAGKQIRTVFKVGYKLEGEQHGAD